MLEIETMALRFIYCVTFNARHAPAPPPPASLDSARDYRITVAAQRIRRIQCEVSWLMISFMAKDLRGEAQMAWLYAAGLRHIGHTSLREIRGDDAASDSPSMRLIFRYRQCAT